MLSNKEVSSVFKMLSALMELHGENDFKSKSYANAAFQLGRIPGQVMKMHSAELEKTPGIGKSVASKIVELQQTGTIQTLENLMQLTPPGIIELMSIKGLGGKKIAVIWKELNIENAGELLYACYENRLAKLKGFGEKTQEGIIKSIEYYQSNMGKFHFATLEKEAHQIVTLLKKEFVTDKISLCGDIRRKCNVVEKIEILFSSQQTEVINKISELNFLNPENISDGKISGKTANEIPFIIYLCDGAKYYFELFTKTGSEFHVNLVLNKIGDRKIQFNSEEEIYKAAAMEYVEPEMREEGIDFTTLKLNDIIKDADIKGVVHSHSTWSDGKNTIEEMANACIKNGYAYLVLSDHSKNAVYAGGLTEQQIIEQHKEIDAINKKSAGFKIFKSIECDILNDGSMDYSNTVLKTFDLVIASVHQNLKMDKEKATNRLLKAIENPYTTILGHLTGRLLLSRPGYPLDHTKIIDACAANNVIIEINANPYRLDIDYTYIPYALKKGVMISVNPDAHSIEGIHDIYYGVCSARKGALTKAMTWNAMNLEELENWIANRKVKKGIM